MEWGDCPSKLSLSFHHKTLQHPDTMHLIKWVIFQILAQIPGCVGCIVAGLEERGGVIVLCVRRQP